MVKSEPAEPIHGVEPFSIKDCTLAATATGRKARALQDFKTALADVEAASVYHHFWGGLLQARFEERGYNNDFAAWVRHGIHDAVLAERLAAIDPTRFPDLEWKYLHRFVAPYDASIFSLAAFAQELPHPQYLIPPSIDPLSDKNVELEIGAVPRIFDQYALDPQRPLLLQVSRFDRFKDPIGVIEAYRLAKRFLPALQLVLAGGGAADDPEGEAVLTEAQAAARGDADVHVLLLPSDAHREINALQRAADIVLQKSIREGFGLTVTEAMWKGKPVIGGDVGGIRLQVINHHTGFLVNTPEGAALRIRYLLHQPEKIAEMGAKAQAFVRDNFLITRHLREYLTLMVALMNSAKDRIELG